ncbi:hypothetical protein OCU04_009152 [Sclerotinia nivalis]|uniref:Uncharacterized protein n=1 Tax=Sclerotinia nivalis TaxID=352851 RepID=A0A9X0DH31_9HELO|nr:hypothetical protein OCU04_009152 [Sclerotinia nivalis]
MVAASPAQLYSSALTFAPEKSLVKKAFIDHLTRGTHVRSKMEPTWTAELQAIEAFDRYDYPKYLPLSADNRFLVSSFNRGHVNEVKIWNALTGTLQNTLYTDSDAVDLMSFSLDGMLLAICVPGFVDIWNAATWARQNRLSQTCDNPARRSECTTTLSFSTDGSFLMSQNSTKVTVWRRRQEDETAWEIHYTYDF